jgi:hypothetical protein
MPNDGRRNGDRGRRDDYRAARIGAAAALVSVLIVVLILDAIVPGYELSPVTIAALCGTIAALVGVELRK